MRKFKLFLSHSSTDSPVIKAFIDFMYKIGLVPEDIIATCSPTNKIAIREDIYDCLRNSLANEKIYMIYFLSDNYYSSPVCLNEMGAAWVRRLDGLSLLLSGFDFDDMQGVIGRNKVGIKLGICDDTTKASFNEFKKDLMRMFGINPTHTLWEIARDEFLLTAVENKRLFDMSFSRGYCIGDIENDGCQIREKAVNSITVKIDFNKTDSKLCDIVIFNGKKNLVNNFISKKNLCFEAYADGEIDKVDVEIRFGSTNPPVDIPIVIYLSELKKTFRISLLDFCCERKLWENVSEIKFVFHKKRVPEARVVTISNLRLE